MNTMTHDLWVIASWRIEEVLRFVYALGLGGTVGAIGLTAGVAIAFGLAGLGVPPRHARPVRIARDDGGVVKLIN